MRFSSSGCAADVGQHAGRVSHVVDAIEAADQIELPLRHRTGLTLREMEVAQLAAGGLSNREIAARLFIGERTVETHIAAIFDRFDLTSQPR